MHDKINPEERFLLEKLDIAFRHLRLSAINVSVTMTIIYIIFMEHIGSIVLNSWFAYGMVVTGMRYWLATIYKNNPFRYDVKVWEQLFVAGVVLGGLIWSAVPFFMIYDMDIVDQTMAIIIIAGITSGSVASLSSHRLSIKIFLSLVLIPLTVKIMLTDGSSYYYLGFLIVFYFFMLLKISSLFHENEVNYICSQKELVISNSYLKGVIDNAPLGIISYDNNLNILEVNNEFAKIVDAPIEYLTGLDMNTLTDRRVLPILVNALEKKNGFYEGEYVTKLKAHHKWIRLYSSPILNDRGEVEGGLGIAQDITDKIKTQQQLEYKARYDLLTHIPNRYTLMERLDNEIARFRRSGNFFSLLFIDLDNFKNINDSFGHSIGDRLIIDVAGRLRSVIRETDIVSRLGGDEFIILLANLGNSAEEAALHTESVIEKVERAVKDPIRIEHHRFEVTVSIGVSLCDSGLSADDLLMRADIAMYSAKKAGRNTFRYYENSMNEFVREHLEIENLLKEAVKQDGFELYYQPVVELKTRRIIAAEALLRLRNDLTLSPERFIRIAEESGLIIPIGEWVLENAIGEYLRWQTMGHALDKIAVNVSAKHFMTTGFIPFLENLLARYPVDPSAIELELTESVLVYDIETSKEKMSRIREMRMGISIDDFGTGYSSLSYLKHIPFTTLKIDRSFTRDILVDEEDKQLVSTIILIAKNLHLQIVVEGVEEYEQLRYLEEKEADTFQGYLCSRPVNSLDFISLLEKDGGYCKPES